MKAIWLFLIMKTTETMKFLIVMDLMDAAMHGIKHYELCNTLTKSPVSHAGAHVVFLQAATGNRISAYFDQIPVEL